MTQVVFDIKNLFNQYFFDSENLGQKSFFYDKFCLTKIFKLKIVLNQTSFWTKNDKDLKFFWTKIIFGPKNILDQKLAWTKEIGMSNQRSSRLAVDWQ